jgi:hypothetical protein
LDDFNISGIGTFDYDGTAKIVTITPKENKTTGAITVYYNGSTTAPITAGVYSVTFNVAEANGFNAVNGLIAGNITINHTSTVSVFGNTIPVKGDGAISPEDFATANGKLDEVMVYYDGLPESSTYRNVFKAVVDRPNFVIIIKTGDAGINKGDTNAIMTIGVDYLITNDRIANITAFREATRNGILAKEPKNTLTPYLAGKWVKKVTVT